MEATGHTRCPQSLDHLRISCDICCRGVLTLAMNKFVAYSPPGEIMHRALFCTTPVPLIEPQSAWNVRLGRRTRGLDLGILQCRNKHLEGLENAPKYAFRDPKIKKKLWRTDSSHSEKRNTLISCSTSIL